MRARGSRRVALLGAFASIVGAIAFAACGNDDIVIGIEGDAGARASVLPSGPPGHLPSPDASMTPGTVADAGYMDVDIGPCLPDAGCSPGSVCEYPVLEAGCGLPGECLQVNGGGAVPPPSPFPLCQPCVFDPYPGFSPTRPDCGAALPPPSPSGGPHDAGAG
jgi:hypothetical protein